MKIVKMTVFLSVLYVIALMAMRPVAPPSAKVVIGYVGGFRGLANIDRVDAAKLTHINYAFVNVKNNRAFLNRPATDSVNLNNLNKLKLKNPALKILISIGGWAWSENFSDAALTDSSRKGFAASAVQIIDQYNLDGVDIDWEYPAIAGEEGNVFRAEDKQNFTLMLKELRISLDSLEQKRKSKKLLTIAVGGFSNFIKHTEMGAAAQYLDYVNLMTYDFFNGEVAGHHTNLYDSKIRPSDHHGDKTFEEYVAAGVPASKLVMGIAFYSRSFTLKQGSKKGLGDSVLSGKFGKGYSFIKDSLVHKNGFKRYWDKEAKAPYLFNADSREYLTYDDEESVKEKCKYVIKNKMAGVMFWEYDSDPNGYLLNQINNSLK